jgi:hypothetical protein
MQYWPGGNTMPSSPVHDWFLNLDAAAQSPSARQTKRRALLASVAVHSLILVLLLGLGFRMRYRAVEWLRGPGPDVPQEPAGIGGLLRARVKWQGGCERIDDSTSSKLVDYAKRRVSTKTKADSSLVALPATDSSLVRAIDADSLCQLAGRAIDRTRSMLVSYRPRRFFLVRAGDSYLAVDTSLGRSTAGDAFQLDSTLSRVLSRGRR